MAEPDDTTPEPKPDLASGKDWQRIGPGRTREEYRTHGQQAQGRIRSRTRADFYSWIETIEALWYLRTELGLGGDEYADEAKQMGVSPTDAKRCVHLFLVLDKLIAWAELEADADTIRTGLPDGKYPSLSAMISRFPPAPSAQARNKKAKANQDAVEEAARNRSDASIRQELLLKQDEITRQRKTMEDALQKERTLREIAERHEATMRKARDEAVAWAESLAAEVAKLKAELAAAKTADPVNNNHPPEVVEDVADEVVEEYPQQQALGGMDDPLPEVGNRPNYAYDYDFAFPGRQTLDDRVLIELRGYVLSVCEDANIPYHVFEKKSKNWWRKQVMKRTVREIYDAATGAAPEEPEEPEPHSGPPT